MKILHICWGTEKTNGAAVVARMIMSEQTAQGHTTALRSWLNVSAIKVSNEVWCHCGWYYGIWWAVLWAKVFKKRICWLPAGCYDPIRLAYHGWKKRLVGPIERWALRHADVIVATCAAEAQWIRAYVGKGCPKVEVTDIRRFFNFRTEAPRDGNDAAQLNVLYLGRPHILKGTKYLEQAIGELNDASSTLNFNYSLRMVSDHSGDALERDWAWCDVLCLPTLSDNFGLVVAEALERGKRVITTDGAPAWEGQTGVVYLRGYRGGTDAHRVELLKSALQAERTRCAR